MNKLIIPNPIYVSLPIRNCHHDEYVVIGQIEILKFLQ